MAHSIKFNTADMSDHKLIVVSSGVNILRQLVSRIQLQDRGYAFRPAREHRHIKIECAVTGTTRADLDANLDNIRLILTELVPKKLVFDALSDRYFNAILESLEGNYDSTTLFRGVLMFVCPDPLGFSTDDPIDHDHDIDEVAKTIYEPAAGVIGGTAYITPVYTLTAQNALEGATIKLENVTTGEELQWIGSLGIGDTLVIDVARWLVSEGAVASMSGVQAGSKFPRLKPAAQNELLVTGLKTTDTGNLNILYSEVYL